MKKFFNFYDIMEASFEKMFREHENRSEQEKEESKQFLKQVEEESKRREARTRYIYSKERAEIFKKMAEKAIAIGRYFDLNVEISYRDEDSDLEEIVLSGNLIHFSDENRSWLDDLYWLITTAEDCVIDATHDQMLLFIFWYHIYEKEYIADEMPEA